MKIYSPLHLFIKPRRQTQIYCTGTAKSGTHSIASLFKDRLRTAHEPESRKLIGIILNRTAGRIGAQEFRRYVLTRDRRLWLEVDSSQLNYFLLQVLVELFPAAKFILTIRNPFAWVDSFINHQLGRGTPEHWQELRDLRFHPERHVHPPEETWLKQNQLFTLDGYLSYWAEHNSGVIKAVPPDRLLVIRTDQIAESVDQIAVFAGLPATALQKEQAHAYPAKARFNVLDGIDRTYLERKVWQHCGDLLDQFFPEAAVQSSSCRSAR